jgi:fermentation-respiration switch protein FrsA (DUF1100 family)
MAEGTRPGSEGRAKGARRRRPWVYPVRVLLACYVGWCGAVYFLQGRILYPTGMLAPVAAQSPHEVESLWIEPRPGVRVEGWLVRPAGCPEGARMPLAVFFHGNAETIDDSIGHAEMYNRLGWAVLLPEYRGYGRSGGRPGQGAMVRDAVAFLDMVRARADIDNSRIVLHGRSIGGGVACAVAAERTPAGLILESTFTSLASFCWKFGVPPVLCSNPYRNDAVVRGLEAPVLVMHGTMDDIVPVAHGRALRDMARKATFLEQPAGHNNFPSDWKAYEGAIASFLAGTK